MPADTSDRSKTFALALLAATQFIVVLDASIVNVALPSIGKDLNFSQDDLSWVVNAYVLVFGGFLLLGGRMADLLGRRRMFISGLILFGVASLAGGLAQSDIQLIVARAFQGLGAAIVSPAALSIVTNTFKEGAERNKALGVWGAVAGSGGAAGVLLGGVLTEYLGWEWVLFVNTPITLFAAFLAPQLLDESLDRQAGTLRHPGRRVGDRRPVDPGLRAGGRRVGGLGLDPDRSGCSRWRSRCWSRSCVIESRTEKPLMPFSIFRLATLRGSNVAGLLIGMSLFSMFFFISLYLQQVLGYEPLKAGLAYLPLVAHDHRERGHRVGSWSRRSASSPCSSPGCCSWRRARSGSRTSRRRAAPTSATCCSRRCSPRSAWASRSSRPRSER